MSAMFSTRPLASLSSQLLARKGQAKPAMRPQGYSGFSGSAAAIDDLGWNDMGHAEPAEPTPIHAASGPVLVSPAAEPAAPTPVPPVVALREALTEKIEAAPESSERPAEPVARPVEPRPISLATANRIGRDSAKQTKAGKAAFTLRLDSERHLRLRIASALANRSAQQIVAEALDRLLDQSPEVDVLIAQLPPPKTRK
jgi:hypothetical protein